MSELDLRDKYHLQHQSSRDYDEKIKWGEILADQRRENLRLSRMLCDEKQKIQQYQQKLQFISDNQDIFEKLREQVIHRKKCQTPCTKSTLDRVNDIDDDICAMKCFVKEKRKRLSECLQNHLSREYPNRLDDMRDKIRVLQDRLNGATQELEQLREASGAPPRELALLRRILAKLAGAVSPGSISIDSSVERLPGLTNRETALARRLVQLYSKSSRSIQSDIVKQKRIEEIRESESTKSSSGCEDSARSSDIFKEESKLLATCSPKDSDIRPREKSPGRFSICSSKKSSVTIIERCPDIKIPGVQYPEIRFQDIRTPEIKITDYRSAEIKIPDPRSPDFRSQDTKISDIRSRDRSPLSDRRAESPAVRPTIAQESLVPKEYSSILSNDTFQEPFQENSSEIISKIQYTDLMKSSSLIPGLKVENSSIKSVKFVETPTVRSQDNTRDKSSTFSHASSSQVLNLKLI